MANVKKIAENSFFVIAENVIQKGIDFLIIIILSGYLSELNYGQYSWIFVYLSICSIFADVGLNSILIRETSKERENAPVLLANGFLLGLIFTVATIVFANMALHITTHSPEVRKYVLIGSLIIIFSPKVNSLRKLLHILFMVDFKIIYVSIFNILGRIVYLISIFFIVKHEASLNWIFLAFALADIPGSVGLFFCYLKFYRFPRLEMKPDLWKKLLRYSLPLFASALFTTLHFKVDVLIISPFLGKEQVAYYFNATKIPELLTFIPIAFLTPFFPILSKKYTLNKEAFLETYKTGLKYLLFFIFPVVFFLFTYMEELILFVFKDKYAHSIPAAKILIFSEIFIYSQGIFNKALVSSNNQKSWLVLTGLSTLTNIIINLILIPLYGITGAAISTTISYSLFIVWGLFLKKTSIYSLIILKSYLKPLAAALVMFVIINYFDLSFWESILPAAAVYIVMLVILKGFNNQDLLFAKELFFKKSEK